MDSSSYVKLFVAELGSEEVIDLFMRAENHTLFVSLLAAVEVRSATRRRQFAGHIDEDSAGRALASLTQEAGRILECPVTAPVVAEAVGLIDRHGLRALDAVQLASAIVTREGLPIGQTLTFVASDHKLLNAAQAEAFHTWDPAIIT